MLQLHPGAHHVLRQSPRQYYRTLSFANAFLFSSNLKTFTFNEDTAAIAAQCNSPTDSQQLVLDYINYLNTQPYLNSFDPDQTVTDLTDFITTVRLAASLFLSLLLTLPSFVVYEPSQRAVQLRSDCLPGATCNTACPPRFHAIDSLSL